MPETNALIAQPVMDQKEVVFQQKAIQNQQDITEAQSGIQDQNIKNLSLVFASVGSQIVDAIANGQQNVVIELRGDARKLFSAHQRTANNNMASRGVAA